MAPLVSICCEVYNHSPFLRDCLEGFVSQKTDFPFEVLIHDDASTDNSAEIIREYDRKYPGLFKPVYQTENKYSRGISIWAEIQFPRASGKYIAICEGDDYWTDPLKLQKQVDFLESHPDYVMCCSAFTETFDGDEQHRTEVIFQPEDITIDNLLQEFWIGTLTTLFRKSAVEGYRPTLDNLPMGDLPLWCHLSTKGKIKYLHDITANYRSLRNSACHFTDQKKEFLFYLDAMRVREYYASLAGKESVAQPYFRKRAVFILNQCYKNHWKDFPVDKVWHFVEKYGNPSGYDRLKHWGMGSNLRYLVSRIILRIKKKSLG